MSKLKSRAVLGMALQQIHLCLMVCVASVYLLGCQAMKDKDLNLVVPIYATRYEAQAVALGQFGAVPIELVDASELAIVELLCSQLVAKVRSPSGKLGWVPVTSVPKIHCWP